MPETVRDAHDPLADSACYSYGLMTANAFAPVRDPQMIMLVKLDFKEDRLGGQVSAPVFAELAPAILTYLGVGPDEPGLVDAPPQAPLR